MKVKQADFLLDARRPKLHYIPYYRKWRLHIIKHKNLENGLISCTLMTCNHNFMVTHFYAILSSRLAKFFTF